MEILDTQFLDISLTDWLIYLATGLGIAALLVGVQAFVAGRAQRLAARTSNVIDDLIVNVISSTRRFTLLGLGLWVAALIRQLPGETRSVVAKGFLLILLVQIGLWGSRLITWWLEQYRARKLAEDPSAVTTMSAAGFVGKIALWSVLLLVALDNYGIDVTALVTGLGIGGVAVALAVQNILGDLFASLSIILDKPFVVGDFLVTGDSQGTVEQIGLKTTRLRSLTGEQLIISNSDLLKSRIRNFKRLYERRIMFTVGLEYGTPRDVLAAVPDVLKAIIEACDDVRFDRAHFKSFGDFALIFEVVYYVLRPEYQAYMDVQQVINLEIVRRFDEIGASMAFPTQKVLVSMEPAANG